MAVVSLLACFFVALLAINKAVSGHMLTDIVLLSTFMAAVSVAASAVLWKRSTLLGGDGLANRIAATTAIASAFFGFVAVVALAAMADQSWVYASQVGAFLTGTGFLTLAFREALVRMPTDA